MYIIYYIKVIETYVRKEPGTYIVTHAIADDMSCV